MTANGVEAQLPLNGTSDLPKPKFRMSIVPFDILVFRYNELILIPESRARNLATREPIRTLHTGPIDRHRPLLHARIRRHTP